MKVIRFVFAFLSLFLFISCDVPQSEFLDVLKGTDITLTAITVDSSLAKNSYGKGASLDVSGLIIHALWSDKTVTTVDSTKAVITGYDAESIGQQTLTVSVTQKECTVSASWVITVTQATPSSISITNPSKTNYALGESLEVSDMVVTVTYTDGSTVTITDSSSYTISGFDNKTAGTQVLTVSYCGCTAQFTVTVSGPVLKSISILSVPTTTEYTEGATPDYTGLEVQGLLTDGTTQTESVSSENIAITGTTAGVQKVTISIGTYEGAPCTASFLLYFYTEDNMISATSAPMYEETSTFANYYIMRTEVPYKLWKEVYDWAVSSDRGADVYTFANKGCEGSSGSAGADDTRHNLPVTTINVRDAKIWCNAASEKAGLTPYYVKSSSDNTVLRDATLSSVDSASANSTDTKGYRLPTSYEWCYAARGGLVAYASNITSTAPASSIEKSFYNYGNTWAGTSSSSDLPLYAVINAEVTSPCASLHGNVLGLYDCSGNVSEFTKSYPYGGAYLYDSSYCTISSYFQTINTSATKYIGFRIVRSY